MIPCQRHLFDIPREVAYFNCSYMGPLANAVREAGERGVGAKARPWQIRARDFFPVVERARSLFGRLMNTSGENISVMPSVSYGLAVAARNLPILPGQAIVVLDGQFPSNVYTWREAARDAGADLITVPRPADGDWTRALSAAITSRTAVTAVANCHWADGGRIDLQKISTDCRQRGSALVLDLTQSLGVMPFDIEVVRPDFALAACYKWLLGPYSLGFMYVAPRWQDGAPIEHTWIARRGSDDFTRLVDYRDDYEPGARRYDVGERSQFHLMPMAVAAMEMILDWGIDEIAATLAGTTGLIAERAAALGLQALPADVRAGHFLGLRFPNGTPIALSERLAAAGVYASVRGDFLRVTPHLYNDEDDVRTLLHALAEAL